MQAYQNTILTIGGTPAGGATVTVLNYPSGTVATIFSTNTGGAQVNPLLTNQFGYFKFYAADGHYSIQVSGPAVASTTFTDILLSDSLASDQPSAISVSPADLVSINQAGTAKQATAAQVSGSSSGTVSSVALTAPAILSVAGSPITTSGTLALSLVTQAANQVWAGPTSGSPGNPAFRSLVPLDYPTFGASGASHSTGAVVDPGASAGTTRFLREDASWQVPPGTSGTVTSVAMTVPAFLSVAGSPITTSGTLAVTANTQSANTALMGPTSGGAVAPTFRTLVTADIPPYTAPWTNAVAETYAAKNQDIISVKDFGAVGDGSTDDTTALQNAITYCIVSQTAGTLVAKGLYLPAGNYKITAALNITTGNTANLTGFHMYGASRFGTTITQFTSNTPIFSLAPNLMHSCSWEHMSFTYNTFQSAQTSANVFNITGTSSNNLYNCKWYDIQANNFNLFMNCTTALWWGNSYEFMWLGDMYQGVNNITGAAGEPRNTFINIYITANSTIGVLFNHNACFCTFYNVEVNAASTGCTMLADSGGGVYVVGHWALEAATYNTAGTYKLWNIPNGFLHAEHIYSTAMTVGTGVTVYAFSTNNNVSSHFDIGKYLVQFTANTGNFFIFDGPGPAISHFRYLDGITFNANCQLTNITAATSADNLCVDEWNNPDLFTLQGDAAVSLTQSSTYLQVFDTTFTANRILTLPEGRNNTSNNLFSGRKFKIVRTSNNVSAFTLTVQDIAGTTIATIPASTTGVVEVMWHRDNGAATFAWVVLGNGPVTSPGRLLAVQTFTASGTYTPTPGTNTLVVEGVGPGGGGGGVAASSGTTNGAAGGGGAGAWGKAQISAPVSQTVTIGTGGAGGAAGANAGNNGSASSSIGTYLVCPAGRGAIAGVTPVAFASTMTFATPGGPGPSPSTTSGTAIYLSAGSPASPGLYGVSGGFAIGGQGGSCPYGGGAGITNGAAGGNGQGFGSGGSGASATSTSTSAAAGGNGANGIIICYDYS